MRRIFARGIAMFAFFWLGFQVWTAAQTEPENLAKIAGIKPAMIVGEVGSGSGSLASAMAEVVGPSGKVYANEISRDALDYINKKGIKNIVTVLGEVDDPLFPRTDLDMVIMENVFHDLENPLSMLENIKKYLKKNAPLVIIEKFPEKTTSPSPGTFHYLPKDRFLDIIHKSSFKLAAPAVDLPAQRKMYFLDVDPDKAKNVWSKWQAEFNQRIDDLLVFEKRADISPGKKRIAWERLLNSFRDNNPETSRDEALRNFIAARIEQINRSLSSPAAVPYESLDADQILKIIEKSGFKDFNIVSGDFPNQYVGVQKGGDSIVIDRAAQLAWPASGSPEALDYFGALEFIEELNRTKFAGYSDWRLPKVAELITLIETDKKSDETRMNELFSNRGASFWSGDYSYPGRARIVNFEPGIIPVWEILKTNLCWVRPVRSTKS